SHLPFPPGPKPRFIIGNLYDIPAELPWLTYADWGKQYGDVVHASVFGEHILVLNSARAASELLEKRAGIYSDRPTIPMVSITGWDFNLTFMPHTDKWRQYRRLFHQHFRRDAVASYRPIQMKKVHDLLRGLLPSGTPEDFFAHTKTVAAAIVMATIYGYDIKPTHDKFVDLSEEAVKRVCESVFPGAFLVNSLPFLRYLPSWFPGCSFQRYGQETKELLAEMRDVPLEFVRKNMRDGIGGFSVLGRLLEKNDTEGGSEAQERVIKEVTATAYAAAADTTASALVSFFLAMALNPEAQRKAQNEIDAVVGPGRLPIFEDRRSLPYVDAVFSDISKAKDAAGNEIEINPLYSDGLVRWVSLFEFGGCTS
ncbi:cytochrome P450, partial [Mycena rosella]